MPELSIDIVDTPFADGSWDRIVEGGDQPNAMMLAGWHAVLSEVFSVRPIYARALEGSDAVAVMALYMSRSIFAGHALRGMDGTTGGSGDPEIRRALLSWAVDFGRRENADFCQFKCPVDDTVLGLEEPKIHTCVDLDPGPDRVWQRITSNTRRKIRKATKSGYRVIDRAAIPDDFARIYLRRQRDLGTPAPSARLFSAMNQAFKGRIAFLGVYSGDDLVGGAVMLHASQRWLNPYVAVEPHAQRNYASYLLYWEMIGCTHARGGVHLDFGRSQLESGTHRFKRQWASKDVLQPSFFVPLKGPKPPVALDRSSGLKHDLWKRLPLAVAAPVGRLLRRSIPFS